MQFHLGPVGALHALPIVERTEQVAATRDQPGGIFTAYDGTRTQQVTGRARGRWVISWVLLSPTQYAVLSALRAGRLGSPLRLIDPERPNLAHPHIATGGSEERSAEGWWASTGTRDWVPISDPPAGVLADGALAWTRPSTAAGDLAPGRTGHSYRYPVLNSQDMRFSQWVRATTGSVTASLGADHFATSGALTTVVGAAATVPTSWTELSYLWTPTAGRVAAAPVLRIAAGQPATTVQVTGVQVVYGAAGQPWQEGGGAPVVLVESLTELRPGAGEVDTVLTLIEA